MCVCVCVCVHARVCVSCVCAVSSITQSCPTLCPPLDYSPTGSSVLGIFLGKNTRVGCQFLTPRNLPASGIEPQSPLSPALQVEFLPAEPSEKPIYIYTHTHTHTHTHTYIYIHIYVYTHIHIYVYTHTYIYIKAM